MLEQLNVTEEMLNSEDNAKTIIPRLTVVRDAISSLRDNVIESKCYNSTGAVLQIELKMSTFNALAVVNTTQRMLEDGPVNHSVLEHLVYEIEESIDKINGLLNSNMTLQIPGQKKVATINTLSVCEFKYKNDINGLLAELEELTSSLDDFSRLTHVNDTLDDATIYDKTTAITQIIEMATTANNLKLAIKREVHTSVLTSMVAHLNGKINEVNNFFMRYKIMVD